MEILAFEQVQFIRQQNALLQDIDWRIKAGEDWAVLGCRKELIAEYDFRQLMAHFW